MSRAVGKSGVGPTVAFVLGAIGMLIEFLGFRFLAAIWGQTRAQFVAVLMPATAALGALWLASARSESPAKLRARCAHALGITGASVALTTIGLAWLSNKLLRFPGGGGPVEAIAFLLPWLLAGFFFGSAYAGLLRNHAHASQSARLGSWFFSAACGAVLAALSLPLFLDFGVGRSLLLVCIACGLLATAVGRRSQGGDVKLSAAATVALAGISLLLGDMGMKPWLVVRHDLARRRSIGYIDWTAQGAVVVDKGRRSKVNYTVDQQPVDVLALDRKGISKPVFGPTDLAYVLPVEAASLANLRRIVRQPKKASKAKPKGRALIVGSGGGRDIRAALGNNFAKVDVIEPSSALVKDVMHGKYGQHNKWFLSDKRIDLRFGDGRGQLRELTPGYDRIVVAGRPRLVQAGPRLLPRDDRLFTQEALRSYLGLLKPDGILVLSTPASVLSDVFRTAEAALGDAKKARDRMFVCSRRDKPGVFLLRLKPIEDTELHRLRRFCKRRRLTIEFPSPAPREGDRNAKQKKRAFRERLAELRAGQVVTDRRPFLITPAPLAAPQWLEAARALTPRSRLKKNNSPKKQRGKKTADAQLKFEQQPAAALGAALCFLLGLLGLLTPVSAREKEARVGVALRLSAPLLGSAVAFASFALGQWILQWIGDPQAAWTLVVPLLLLGLASGQRMADTVAAHRLLSRAAVAAVVGVLLLVLSAWVLPQLQGHGGWGAMALAAGASMALLLPLGLFFALVLRSVHSQQGTAVASVWGWYASGWALALAVAPVVCWRSGQAKLLPLAAVCLAVAALLALGISSAPSQQPSQVEDA
jgi:SAM-dependent methyltransferase